MCLNGSVDWLTGLVDNCLRGLDWNSKIIYHSNLFVVRDIVQISPRKFTYSSANLNDKSDAVRKHQTNTKALSKGQIDRLIDRNDCFVTPEVDE